MSERFRIIPKKKFEIVKKRFDILGVSDETPLSAIQPITKSALVPNSREDLVNIVEAPLLEACQILYDKNIKTVMSSANKEDMKSGIAWIAIDVGSLSEENKEVAKELGKIYMMHGSVPRPAINLEISISQNTTVDDIRKIALKMVEKFKQQ